ncbi:unnamed protein product, partial [Ectocarpus sp. 4 AP-2014]
GRQGHGGRTLAGRRHVPALCHRPRALEGGGRHSDPRHRMGGPEGRKQDSHQVGGRTAALAHPEGQCRGRQRHSP